MIEKIVETVRSAIDPTSHGKKRSSEWPSVRKAYLQKNPVCAVCGGFKKLEVHHIEPFHLNPEKELIEGNLITLCEANKWLNCHLFVGHRGNYKDSNPTVKQDAFYLLEKIFKLRKIETTSTGLESTQE